MTKKNDTVTSADESTILERAVARAKELGVEARLETRLLDREVRGVLRNFLSEIDREAIDVRREMLIAAAVEMLVMDKPAAECARSERALRTVDTSDLRELRKIATTVATGLALGTWGTTYANGIARRRTLEASPNRDVLEVLGFVRLDASGGTHVELPLVVTPRGELVLSLVSAWS